MTTDTNPTESYGTINGIPAMLVAKSVLRTVKSAQRYRKAVAANKTRSNESVVSLGIYEALLQHLADDFELGMTPTALQYVIDKVIVSVPEIEVGVRSRDEAVAMRRRYRGDVISWFVAHSNTGFGARNYVDAESVALYKAACDAEKVFA
jgi:hypothetical protein